MKRIIAILLIGFIVLQFADVQHVVEVEAESEPAVEYMPPYLQTDLIVNISIEAFDFGLIGTGDNLSISSIQENTDNMRVRISSMLEVSDFERGWKVFDVSLSAYKRQAKITPMNVEKIESENPYKPGATYFTYSVSKQYENSIDTFVLYPSSLNENETRDSTSIIGWENSEKSKETHSSILKRLGLEADTDVLTVTPLHEFSRGRSQQIKSMKIRVPDKIPSDNEKLNFQDFTVASDLSNTIFGWIVESFGFDLNNPGETKYIRSFYATGMQIEKYIPYEFDSGNWFHDAIINTVVKAVDDVVIKPAIAVISDPIGSTARAVVSAVTTPINAVVKSAEGCITLNIGTCINAISGAAIDIATKTVFPSQLWTNPQPTPEQPDPAPPSIPEYPLTSDIPANTSTNILTAPLGFISSLIPPDTSKTTLLIGGVLAVGLTGVSIFILLRMTKSKPQNNSSSKKK